jgi:hypothetical protein
LHPENGARWFYGSGLRNKFFKLSPLHRGNGQFVLSVLKVRSAISKNKLVGYKPNQQSNTSVRSNSLNSPELLINFLVHALKTKGSK